MANKELKEQISDLRNSIFKDKNSSEKQSNKEIIEAANVNSHNNIKKEPTGIFQDVRSMDKRLKKLEESFYGYAYDSTKVLTTFHRNMKRLEALMIEISNKSNSSSDTVNRIEDSLPHACPLVPKEGGDSIIKKRRSLFKNILLFLSFLFIVTVAVFLSNLAYEIIYMNLKALISKTTIS